MTFKLKTLVTATTTAALLSAPAFAAMTATATTDLNFRAGPGAQYKTLGTIGADESVTVEGCIGAGDWCKVEVNGQSGWAYSPYLTTPVNDEPVLIYQNQKQLDIETVTYDETSTGEAALAGGTFGALAGSLIVGGPAAIAAGAVLGMAGGAAADPDPVTVTYVTEHPVEPVWLDGEVVVGAGIPDNIETYEIPDSDFQYINVNSETVIVNPEDRRIVKIIR
ncbi:DUF1236 domain-containing protein [Celeribacter persicus]|uniref:SH3 domain-containing protein n=1 Tax=Celeribacter persicus TaxID=1651082 RepID=A0A2T5HUJ3_9RHOB|nr:DUF1236 domain-containing protein [Celeribacter persicus]PTQ75269.1 SH3 domain-containing protein [Celeribacter persicus]